MGTRLKDKVAIVTGGARGIGAEIVRELLGMGMTVIAVDLKADLLAALPAALGNPGEKLQTAILTLGMTAGGLAGAVMMLSKHEY